MQRHEQFRITCTANSVPWSGEDSCGTSLFVGLEFLIPAFVLKAQEDFTTSSLLAEHYVERIKAPRKELVAIKGGGQRAVFKHSDQFLEGLITHVRPLAAGHWRQQEKLKNKVHDLSLGPAAS